jgi:hypothetical protein
MDAATLLVTTVARGPQDQPVPTGQAILTVKGGGHLVEDLSAFLSFPGDGTVMVERAEFDTARERLRRAGMRLEPDADASWAKFAEVRSGYATALNLMASHLLTPPSTWIGDRSILPHGKLAAEVVPVNPAARRAQSHRTADDSSAASLPAFQVGPIIYLGDDNGAAPVPVGAPAADGSSANAEREGIRTRRVRRQRP